MLFLVINVDLFFIFFLVTGKIDFGNILNVRSSQNFISCVVISTFIILKCNYELSIAYLFKYFQRLYCD